MKRCFRILFLLCLSIRSQCQHPSYSNDGMGREDKEKLQKIALELLVEAKLEQRQSFTIRNAHSIRLAYDVGLIMGRIREKYKRMMDIYREMIDRSRGRQLLFPPGVWSNKPFHYVLAMETVVHHEHEIDKLIQVLDAIPKEDFNKELESFQSGSGNPFLRMGSEIGDVTNVILPVTPKGFETEQGLKQYYKEQYENKSGHNSQWTLDQYYGFTP